MVVMAIAPTQAAEDEALRLMTYFKLVGASKFLVIRDECMAVDMVTAELPNGKPIRMYFENIEPRLLQYLLDTNAK